MLDKFNSNLVLGGTGAPYYILRSSNGSSESSELLRRTRMFSKSTQSLEATQQNPFLPSLAPFEKNCKSQIEPRRSMPGRITTRGVFVTEGTRTTDFTMAQLAAGWSKGFKFDSLVIDKETAMTEGQFVQIWREAELAIMVGD